MKLIVIRHGESEGNISHLIQGVTTKSNLTDIGREQVSKLAKKLSDVKIDLAFVSPLDRAKQTAEIILEQHSTTKIELAEQLKEKDAGEFTGRPGDEMLNAWESSGLPFGEFQPEGGESWYQVGERVISFVEEIINQYKNTNIVVLLIGHGSIFTYLLMWADRFDPKESNKEKYDYYHPANTAIAIIKVNQEGKPTLVSINDTSHLD